MYIGPLIELTLYRNNIWLALCIGELTVAVPKVQTTKYIGGKSYRSERSCWQDVTGDKNARTNNCIGDKTNNNSLTEKTYLNKSTGEYYLPADQTCQREKLNCKKRPLWILTNNTKRQEIKIKGFKSGKRNFKQQRTKIWGDSSMKWQISNKSHSKTNKLLISISYITFTYKEKKNAWKPISACGQLLFFIRRVHIVSDTSTFLSGTSSQQYTLSLILYVPVCFFNVWPLYCTVQRGGMSVFCFFTNQTAVPHEWYWRYRTQNAKYKIWHLFCP